MGERTNIGWTDATWNPWHGCQKVSPGCKHCYMYRDKERYGQDPTKVVRSKTTFRNPLKWTEPRMVFTCSWSDWFIKEADAWRDEAWEIIRQTPQHTYQILTKRAERIAAHLPADWGDGYPNVWLGVSCENQRYAEQRYPELRRIPARIRFVSCEPLLGPIKLSGCLSILGLRGIISEAPEAYAILNLRKWGPDWVIAGGESGPKCRTMDMGWLGGIEAECTAAGIPLYVKQDSGPRDSMQGRIPDALWARKDFPYVLGAERGGVET